MKIQQTVQLRAETSFEEAVKDFLLHQRSARHSPHTVAHYRVSLGHLVTFLEGLGLTSIDIVMTRHLRSFLVEIQDRFRPKTAHGIATDVKAFFTFQKREGVIPTNPMELIEMPKLDKTILPAFSKDEVQKLIKASSSKDNLSIRNLAIILVLLDSGIRLHELVGMKIGDVDEECGLFKVLGKGRKERLCQLSPASLRVLLKYCRFRKGAAGEPLWCGTRGSLTMTGVSQMLAALGEKTSIHVHPHKFRRTCALTMLRNGADLFSVQYLLGHSDLTVLKRYIAQDQTDYLNSHKKYSPVMSLLGRT